MIQRGQRQRQRSKTLIQQAFSELLRESPYAAIQVSEIIVRANVGRTTFYRYYGGKVDILIDMHRGIFSKLMSDFPTVAHWLGDVPSPSILRFLTLGLQMRQKGFSLGNALGGDLALITASLDQLLAEALQGQLRQVFETEPAGLSMDFLTHAISALYVTQIMRWLIQSDVTEDVEAYARSLQRGCAALVGSAYGLSL